MTGHVGLIIAEPLACKEENTGGQVADETSCVDHSGQKVPPLRLEHRALHHEAAQKHPRDAKQQESAAAGTLEQEMAAARDKPSQRDRWRPGRYWRHRLLLFFFLGHSSTSFSVTGALLRLAASEVCGVVRRTGVGICCNLRLGAERPRTYYLATDDAAGLNGIRRNSLLHPRGERTQGIELVRTHTIATMEHARNHKQTEEISGGGSHSLPHTLVIFHTHHWVQRWIRP